MQVTNSVYIIAINNMFNSSSYTFLTFNQICSKPLFSRAEEGDDRKLSESAQHKFTSSLLQCLRDRNVSLQLGHNENTKCVEWFVVIIFVVFNHFSGH